MLGFLRKWHRGRKLASMTIPAELWERVEGELPFLAYLPPADRLRLRDTGSGAPDRSGVRQMTV